MASDPPYACSLIKPPPFNASNVNWIALVRRFECPFKDKIQNAQDAGYSGIIVYNYEPNRENKINALVNRHVSTAALGFDEFNIPAILISSEDGAMLNRSYLYQNGYYVIISPDLQFNLSAYLLPFAIVISVCLLLMITFMIIKCIRDRRKSQRHRLSSRHLKKLPTTKFKKGEHYDTCAICLDEYTEGEKLRLLPCGHG